MTTPEPPGRLTDLSGWGDQTGYFGLWPETPVRDISKTILFPYPVDSESTNVPSKKGARSSLTSRGRSRPSLWMPLAVAALWIGAAAAWAVLGVVGLPIAAAALLVAFVGATQRLARARSHQVRLEAAFAYVHTATRSLAAHDDLDGATAASAEMLRHLFRGDAVAVALSDADGSTVFRVVHSAGLDPALNSMSIDVSAERSGLGVAIRAADTLFVSDARSSLLLAPRFVRAAESKSVCFVPLPGHDGIIGAVIVVWRRLVRTIDATDRQAAEIMAGEAGLVIERLREAARVAQEAETDALTALPNRRAFNRRVGVSSPGDALLIVDLDDFKQVNEVYGHNVGDETLRKMARCLEAAMRDGDMAARLNGEEFGVILAEASTSGALAFLERLHRRWQESEVVTTFSAGYAIRTPGEGQVSTLGRADTALHAQKAQRQGQVKAG